MGAVVNIPVDPASPCAGPRRGVIDEGTAAATTRRDAALGQRAARTRDAILEGARRLFLDRGYAGTRIGNITDACGISRAGFYTYFRDKREVFNALGENAYRDILKIVSRWEVMPRPCDLPDVIGWVRAYFAFMDVHGAFIFASGPSAPADEQFRTSSRRMQMRVAFLLGANLRGRQAEPTIVPEALGLSIMGMLERAWYYCRAQELPVGDDDIIRTVARLILSDLSPAH
ncbi:TetR/AcrR family transcriptional regulator [Frankia sp. CiP1_Cm_nod2]|uniref:TetR/AcrR family transcriptional regulator n=1 Tax=Frankia sp. CiP1_Cm_nod2 TaxID=2897161 RepID=UPI0020242634